MTSTPSSVATKLKRGLALLVRLTRARRSDEGVEIEVAEFQSPFAPDAKKAKDRGRAATNSNYRSSELGKAFTEAEAGRLLAEGLEHFGLDEAALRKPPKGDWRKVAVAWAICEHTTAGQKWIAERLHLKSASNVSQRVRQYRLLDPAEKTRAMRAWEKRMAG